MKEFDTKGPETAEEWSYYLEKFAAETKFGTPEHSAVSDFLNLQNHYSSFGETPQDSLADINGEKRLSPESRRKITEYKIALLEHTIEQNIFRVPGYSNAYVHVSNGFQDLVGIAAEEAIAKFSKEEQQKTYIQEIYDKTIDRMNFAVFEIQNQP